jgi:hypothetical protein
MFFILAVLAGSISPARAAAQTPAVLPLRERGPVYDRWLADRLETVLQNGVPGTGDYPLFAQTCYSIELNVTASVPEWDGQDVQFALEQDAVFDRNGARFLDRRQTGFHLVR